MTANLPSLLASDLEGVLIPEIWVGVAEATGIETLKLTTREIANYDDLMQLRLRTMREHGLTIHDVHNVVATMKPLPGAVQFVQWVRERTRFVIITDSFYEFLEPILPKLGYPTVFAHALDVAADGEITGYRLRMADSKRVAVQSLHAIGFRVMAFGDSYNDTPMLSAADLGVFFDPPASILAEFPQFAAAYDYEELQAIAEGFLDQPVPRLIGDTALSRGAGRGITLFEIGLFYGSTNGDTRRVAEQICSLCECTSPPDQPWARVEMLDVANIYLEEMVAFPALILGASTWNHGQMQRDWEHVFGEFDAIDLTARPVALFGLGDQVGYPDTFMDALIFLADKVIDRGAHLIGAWPVDATYTHRESWAVRDGRFVGLALDEVNQPELTTVRLKSWLAGVRAELVTYGLPPTCA